MRDIFWTILASLHYTIGPLELPFVENPVEPHWNIIDAYEEPPWNKLLPTFSRVRSVLAAMVLWVTWRTLEFTSFWAMAVPAWDMQAPCQVVTLVISWRCTDNKPKNDRTGRCDLTWLYFFEGWSLGMYMYQWLHATKSERMEREDWQGQLFKSGSAYTPNIVKCFKSQHAILTWHVGRSGVKCNPPSAWWFQMYMWRSQAWWSQACSEVRKPQDNHQDVTLTEPVL